MSNRQRQIVFYRSVPQQCGYLPRRNAINAVMDPEIVPDTMLYTRLIELGFRRSGSRIYRPNCPGCSACMALRVPVQAFRPDRSQRRAWRRHAHWEVHERAPEFREEHYALYRRYLASRHPDGGMEESGPEDYLAFLLCKGVETHFIEFREAGQCVAVAVTDALVNGLSAVYTFYDPELEGSPGVHAVLWQIEAARRRGLQWLYLGYWIAECRKMSYKVRYRPCEVFVDGVWREPDWPE